MSNRLHFQRMQPEGEVSFAVQIGEGILEQGILPGIIQIGMEEDVDE